MAVDIARLGIEIDSKDALTASRNLDTFAASGKRAESATERLQAQARTAARALGAIAVAGAAATAMFSARALKMAVDAEETASKFQVVFRGSVEATDKALIEMGKTIPLTRTEMRGLASSVQDMIVPLGIARDEAAKLSVNALQLAADIGSFNNVDAAQVLMDIQSGLAGSSEPLRKYGIDVREAALQTVALEAGLIKTKDEWDQNARAQALFLKIAADSSDAMGDQARTADSTANQMRRLSRDFRQMQEDLGTYLIPAFRDFLSVLNEVGDDGTTRAQSGLKDLGQAMMTVISAFLIVKEAASLVGVAILGLAVNIQASLQAIATPFTEFYKTMAVASQAFIDRDLAGVAEAFDGLVERIAVSFDEYGDRAADGLGFIGESFEDGIKETLTTVNTLMNSFKIDVAKPLKESEKAAQSGGQQLGETIGMAISTGIRKTSPAIMNELESAMNFIDFEGVRLALTEEAEALKGGEEAWREYQKAQFIASETAALGKDATVEQVKAIEELAGQIFELRNPMQNLAEIQVTLGDTMQAYGSAFEDVIRSVQGGVERGTNEYKRLEIAVQAVNILQAIGAILNQAQGDPYTAVPRMAAMASIVSSIVGAVFSISGMSGGSNDPTAARQASVGTGTVLGDSEAKTESIMNSLEITANATSELVGINRGMLRALTNLVDAISGASTLLARGFGDTDFGALPKAPDFKAFGFDSILGKALDPFGFLGGSVKLADTGLRIDEGSLAELINGSLISAFQDLNVKKNIFSSSKLRRTLVDLDEATQNQFGAVFEALVSTVTEAATVLGFSMDEIQASLDAFTVYAQDISLEDLNAEEQQEAITAFFGSVFDRLAHDVVSFLPSLQKVGEGFGETLVRAATSIQVFDLALERLPFTFGLTEGMFASMEDFRFRTVMLKVGLVEAAGGLDEFISNFSAFFDAFATDQQKFDMLLDGLTMQFADFGLQLPATRDGLWDLMGAQDAATESGQEVIAMILDLTGELDSFYNMAESRLGTVTDFLDIGPSSGLQNLIGGFKEAMQAAKDLGATQREYALIARSFERQLARFTAGLQRQAIQLAQSLFSGNGGLADGVEQGMDEVRQITNSVFADWTRALQGIRAYTDSLLLDENLTPLNPAQQLAEAESQFRTLLAAARGGDADAAAQLPAAAQAFLEEARFMFASGAQYDAIFRDVMSALEGIEMPDGIEEYTLEIVRNTDRTANEIRTLQDEMITRLDRLIQAMDLAAVLSDLGYALNQSPIAIADELGIPIDGLARALGIDLNGQTIETLNGLLSMADMLGADIFELGDRLGVDVVGLADRFGVALEDLNFSSQFATELETLDSILGEIGLSNDYLAILAGVTLTPVDPGILPDRTGPGPIGPMPQGPSSAAAADATGPAMTGEDTATIIELLQEDVDQNAVTNRRIITLLESINAETEQTKEATIRMSA